MGAPRSDGAHTPACWSCPVIALKIHHKTVYRFRQPVSLRAHRLILRPRESRDLRLMSHTLAITPTPVVTWAHDVFGNAVATATFATTTDMLVIDSVADILLNAVPWPVFDIAASAISYPFRYSDDEWTDLGALAIEQYPDQAGRLRIWARGFIRGNPTDTLSLLKDLSPASRSGSAIRAVRLRAPSRRPRRSTAAGAHAGISRCCSQKRRAASGSAHASSPAISTIPIGKAWDRASGIDPRLGGSYVPGAGWITFDPTNRSVGGFNLIPVAVVRDIRQVMPVSGSFVGMTDAFQGMAVELSVTS